MNRFRVCFLAFSALVVVPARASAAEYLVERGGWDVGRDGDTCAMSMDYEGEGATKLMIASQGKPDDTLLILTNLNWSTKDEATYRIEYHMGEYYYTIPSWGVTIGGYRHGFSTIASSNFLADFARSKSLRVVRDGTLVDQLNLTGSSVALTEFNRCVAALRREQAKEASDQARLAHIPRDPFAGSAAEADIPPDRRAPVPEEQYQWASRIQENYPAIAVRNGWSGTVGVRLSVDAGGRVSACEVTEPSAHLELDQAACDGARRYARFKPAIDAGGQPTPGEFSTKIVYDINK